MKTIIKAVCVFASAVLVLASFPWTVASAIELPTISLSDASITLGTRDMADINVSLSENPGISSLKLSIYYDENELELAAAAFSPKALETGAQTMINTKTPGVIVLNYLLISGELKLNGTFATISFMTRPNTVPGDYLIQVTYDPEDVFGEEMNNVRFAVLHGNISISLEPSTSNVTPTQIIMVPLSRPRSKKTS